MHVDLTSLINLTDSFSSTLTHYSDGTRSKANKRHLIEKKLQFYIVKLHHPGIQVWCHLFQITFGTFNRTYYTNIVAVVCWQWLMVAEVLRGQTSSAPLSAKVRLHSIYTPLFAGLSRSRLGVTQHRARRLLWGGVSLSTNMPQTPNNFSILESIFCLLTEIFKVDSKIAPTGNFFYFLMCLQDQ